MTVTADRESRRVVSNVGFANPITLDQYVESATHVGVYRETDGVIAQLSVGTHYTIAGVGDNDGIEVTITATGLALNPDQWIVVHQPPLEQGANLSLGGRFGLAYEQAMDALVRRMQAITERMNRVMTLSIAVPEDQEPIALPLAEAGKALIWNETEDGFANSEVSPDDFSDAAAAAIASAAAAAGSASAAATSASAASSSQTAAAGSATAAAGSATAASGSATAAAGSATTASGHATTATTQATNAATSATNAATSATNAAGSENDAAVEASAADASATAAAASATAAAASEAQCVILEGNSAASAASALASAAAAASSASGLRGMLHGLRIVNGTDAVNDINVEIGACRTDADDDQMLVSAQINAKQLDAAWAAGGGAGMRDTGAIADGTWHIFLIKNNAGTVVDVLASLSATAPTMPSGYAKKRRIGSIIRASGSILAFKQEGDRFRLVTPIVEVNVTNPGTAAVTRTLTSVPAGLVLFADIVASGTNLTSNAYHVLLTSLDETDTTPDVNFKSFAVGTVANAGMEGKALMNIKTNTSRQIRSRQSLSGASDTFKITTYGWTDTRGRLG